MITFWIGAMVGCAVGVGTVCFLAVAAEEDRWLEKKTATLTMDGRVCPFCGGQMSEIRYHGDKKYRHCYSCHFDQYEL